MIYRQDGQVIEKVDFNIVDIGLSRELTLEVVNDQKGGLENLIFYVEGAEIVSAPTYIAPFATEAVVVTWTPSLDLEDPLVGKIGATGKRVYRD